MEFDLQLFKASAGGVRFKSTYGGMRPPRPGPTAWPPGQTQSTQSQPFFKIETEQVPVPAFRAPGAPLLPQVRYPTLVELFSSGPSAPAMMTAGFIGSNPTREKIKMIKLIRELTGMGLTESKDLTDKAESVGTQYISIPVYQRDYFVAQANAFGYGVTTPAHVKGS